MGTHLKRSNTKPMPTPSNNRNNPCLLPRFDIPIIFGSVCIMHGEQHPEGESLTRGKHHLLHQRYPGGFSRGRYSHARAEGEHCPMTCWIKSAELSIVTTKTEAVLFTCRRWFSPSFHLKGAQIRLCTAPKYLRAVV